MSKTRMSSEERKAQIVEAAMCIFSRKGFKGTTTREIAKAVGISEPLIFQLFATKEALYDAIIEKRVEGWERAWREEPLPEEADLAACLKTFARRYIRRNREDPSFLRLMMYSALEEHRFRERFFEIGRFPYSKVLMRRIQEGVQQGVYRTVEPHLAVRAFFSMLRQYCISRFVGACRAFHEDDEEKAVDTFVTLFMEGITGR